MNSKENEKDLKNKKDQNELEFFNGLDSLNSNKNYSPDELNFDNIREIGQKDNKKIEDIKNDKTKAKTITKKSQDNSTTIKTMPTKRQIIDMVTNKTSLLDLEINGKDLNELIREEEERLTKENYINQELNKDNEEICNDNEIIKINENNINEVDNKKLKIEKNISDESISEENEEIKKERIITIEKMKKKTDEIVDVPGFNIFDETKMNFIKNKNDLLEEK